MIHMLVGTVSMVVLLTLGLIATWSIVLVVMTSLAILGLITKAKHITGTVLTEGAWRGGNGHVKTHRDDLVPIGKPPAPKPNT